MSGTPPFADRAVRPAGRRLGPMSHGPQAGQWRDVSLLERRSDTVGT